MIVKICNYQALSLNFIPAVNITQPVPWKSLQNFLIYKAHCMEIICNYYSNGITELQIFVKQLQT